MNKNIIYLGAFISFDELHSRLEGERLPFIIPNPHVTFAYRPDDIDTSLFGEPVTVIAVGYGNNKKSEGLKVELTTENPKLRDMISKIEIPHITVSKTPDTPSVDTRYLTFTPIKPFKLKAVYGGFEG